MNKNLFGIAIVAAGAMISAAAPRGLVQDEGTSGPNEVTDQGALLGTTIGEVDQFLGIPYAAPPVGELRWRPPAKAPQWQGVRDATMPGSKCFQPALATASAAGTALIGSEDCLYLNVYRPAQSGTAKLPVLIFIHGGSNQRGAGSEYDPSEMVSKGHIVAVTVNYRLNVFGFLALPSLDSEAGDVSSGNFGLLDQQAAMRWVQENIAAFGGDPSNVTISGESAGGIDVCAHLTSPSATGLFHRAILESMYCPDARHEDALKIGTQVQNALGCAERQLTCLRSKAPDEIINAAQPLSVAPGSAQGFSASPNSGGAVLPLPPLDALRSGQWNQSTILIGSNHDEAALFVTAGLLRTGIGTAIGPAAYRLLVRRHWRAYAPEVMAEYPMPNYSSPFAAYSAEATDDSPLGCPVTSLADTFAKIATTYRYEFNDPEAPAPAVLKSSSGASIGAYHGSELQYLYRISRLPGPQTSAQQDLSNQMIGYWTNFVKSGNANGSGLPDWMPYDASARQLISLAPAGGRMIDNFDGEHHCAFWMAKPEPGRWPDYSETAKKENGQ